MLAGCGLPLIGVRRDYMIFFRRTVAVAALACALAACSSQSGTGDSESPASSSPPSTDPHASTTDVEPSATTGCPDSGGGIPADASVTDIIDVDGDQQPDRAWLEDAAGQLTFGITTATNGTATAPIDLAGGGGRSALVADYDGRGDILAFVSDGRTADLLAYSQCSLITVQNPEAEPYQFDLGFRGNGTGLGCVDASGDGVPDLVGLNVLVDGSGQATSIDRTIIEVDGPRASNGASDSVAITDPAQAELGHQITCGDLTIADDGVSLPG